MIRTSLFVSFSLLLISQCTAGDPCPNKTKILPCTCTQKPMLYTEPILYTQKPILTETTPPSTALPAPRRKWNVEDNISTPEFTKDNPTITTILCESPKTLPELEEKVSIAVDRKWIDKLVISNIPPEQGNTLSRLPSNWLRNGRIRQLEIQNTQLIGDFIWNGNSLKDQTECLHWLKVNNCYLFGLLTYDTVGTVQTRGLNYLKRLQGIDFSSNHLSTISVLAFKAPPQNLSTIILANNNIQHIDASSFNQIILLKHIDLSHNLLTLVSRSYFAAPAKVLEHIDLSWNSMQSLPQDLFVNMAALKWVDVSNNFLHSLPVRPWSVVWKQLSFINVSSNFIECDCHVLWLLPILLPPSTNQTEPKSLPGQTVLGKCVQLLSRTQELAQPIQTVSHNIISLKRDMLSC